MRMCIGSDDLLYFTESVIHWSYSRLKPHIFSHILHSNEHVSASTQHQALNAIAFLYHQVLNKRLGAINNIPRPTKPKRLPVVLTSVEVMWVRF